MVGVRETHVSVSTRTLVVTTGEIKHGTAANSLVTDSTGSAPRRPDSLRPSLVIALTERVATLTPPRPSHAARAPGDDRSCFRTRHVTSRHVINSRRPGSRRAAHVTRSNIRLRGAKRRFQWDVRLTRVFTSRHVGTRCGDVKTSRRRQVSMRELERNKPL